MCIKTLNNFDQRTFHPDQNAILHYCPKMIHENSLNLDCMTTKKIRLVATDLDGTFLKNDRSISGRNLDALRFLGEKGVVRVAATGRNLRKVHEVIPEEVPFDYIIYSSGAGIYDWQAKKHIFQQNIDCVPASELSRYFREKNYNFSVFAPAPDNHKLWFHKGGAECEEFDRFFSFHDGWSESLPLNCGFADGFCQFLLIIPENEQKFSELKAEIESISDQIRVIRSSSPVTKGYIWVEVFHCEVSKGKGVKHLCYLLSIHPEETAGVGNDYNDLDLLEFTAFSFVAENAPETIRAAYIKVPSNEEDAFYHAVQPILD